MGAYETTLPVRFGQVDYAGIMFYPRFFENFHAVFEDMFSDRLGVPYMSILKDRRIGFPTVHIETDFVKPFRFGEHLGLITLDAYAQNPGLLSSIDRQNAMRRNARDRFARKPASQHGLQAFNFLGVEGKVGIGNDHTVRQRQTVQKQHSGIQ